MPVEVRFLRESLRQTEACVLDADETAVTVAVRIPHRTIRENHGLLSALSEAGIAWGDPPKAILVETSSHTKCRPKRLRASLVSLRKALPSIAGIGFIALAIGAVGTAAIAEFKRPDFEQQSATLLTPWVHQGEDLQFEFVARANPDCQLTVEREIDDSIGTAVWFHQGAAPIIASDWENRTASVHIGSHLPPGGYVYSSKIYARCGWRHEVYTGVQGVAFEIVR